MCPIEGERAMRNRLISLLLVVTMLSGFLPAEGVNLTRTWETAQAVASGNNEIPEDTAREPLQSAAQVTGLSEAVSGYCGGDSAGKNLAWTLSTSGTLTISGSGAMADFEEKKTPWNAYAEQILSVEIGNGVQSIGKNAFRYCVNLKQVTIPDSVTSIGVYSFDSCESLTKVTIPGGVTAIADGTFRNCAKLASAVIPEGVKSIGKSAFSGCARLEDVVIPSSVTGIGNAAFYGCARIEDVTIPSGVTALSAYLFTNCTSLRSIAIPGGVTSIGMWTFKECKALTDVTFNGTEDQWNSIAVSDGNEVLQSADIVFKKNEIPNTGYSGTCGTRLTWALSTDGTLTIKGTGEMDDFADKKMPWYAYAAQITYVKILDGVESIGNNAFRSCENLEKVSIPDTVTSIGEYAFDSCESLEKVTLPDGLTTIEGGVFRFCTNLFKVTIPGSVTSIGRSAFSHCESLEEITIPSGVTSIGNAAFYGCESLTSVTIPNGVKTLSPYTFSSCTGLKKVTIPGTVTTIGEYAFDACSALTKVVFYGTEEQWKSITVGSNNGALQKATVTFTTPEIPEGGLTGKCGERLTWELTAKGKLYIDGKGAMYDYAENAAPWAAYAEQITSLAVTSGVEHIGDNAFRNCTNLQSAELYDTVTSIGKYAFDSCTSLQKITIPDGVTEIQDGTFRKCENLVEVEIPDSVTSIGKSAFSGCPRLYSILIPDSVTSIGNAAFYGCSRLVHVTIPGGVTTLSEYAFSECTGIESVVVMGSMKRIDFQAFYRCSSLSNIYFVGTEDQWKSITIASGNSYLENAARLYMGSVIASGTCGYSTTWMLTSDGTLIIGGDGYMSNYAQGEAPWYEYRKQITNLVVTYGVRNIGENTFRRCTNLVSVTISDSVTTINDYAFHGCSGLTKITLPERLDIIGDSAFSGCEQLADIVIPDSVTEIGDYAFDDCESLVSITLPGGVNMLRSYVFYNCNSLTTVVLSDGVKAIGDYAFAGCDNLECITIPNSVESVGDRAFYNCTALKSIKIPAGVQTMGESVFRECTGLTHVTIPGSVSNIGEYAFRDCTSLVSVSIGKGVTEIGRSAFQGCTSLAHITIPDSVVIIDRHAFFGCTTLNSLTIGSGISTINGDAFGDCTALTDIYYSGTKTQWNSITIGAGNDVLQNCEITFEWSGGQIIEGDTVVNGTCGDDLIWALTSEGTLIVSGTGAMADYKDVTAPWSGYADQITSVEIAYGVESIGIKAFLNCTRIAHITIPDSVTAIGAYAFDGCTSLAGITVPGGVTEIENGTFRGCTSLVSAALPDSVKSIGQSAFSGCINLAQAPIPGSVTGFGNSAFFGCTRIKTVTIPDGVTSISQYLFLGCTALTSITLPGGLTDIGAQAFKGCSALSTVNFNGTEEQWNAVKIDFDNEPLQKVHVTFRGTVVYSGQCGEDLIWSLTSNGTLAISGTGTMTDYTNGRAPWSSYASQITSVEIAYGVESISVNAFISCSNLTAVTIPGSVRAIGGYAFDGCKSLTSIAIPDGVTAIENGTFHGCASLVSVVIPDGVKSIGQSAFSGCASLTIAPIPDSVTSIGNAAFFGCARITTVTIPKGVTGMSQYLFQDCTGLKSITILGDVTEIGFWALRNCKSLSNVYFAGTESQWHSIQIASGNEVLHNVNLTCTGDIIDSGLCGANTIWMFSSNGTLYIGGTGDMDDFKEDQAPWYAYAAQITDVVINRGVEGIGNNALRKCTNLKSVTIPDGVKRIGSYAFAGCTSLSNIKIPDSVTTIADGTFYQCASLVKVTIPDKLTSIGHSAFSGCAKLSDVTIPTNAKTIGSSAFFGCESISSLVFASVETIGGWAFANCTNLTSVTIHKTLQSVGQQAFDNCAKLKKVSFYGTQTQWDAIEIAGGNSALSNVEIIDNRTVLRAVRIDDGDITVNYKGYGMVHFILKDEKNNAVAGKILVNCSVNGKTTKLITDGNGHFYVRLPDVSEDTVFTVDLWIDGTDYVLARARHGITVNVTPLLYSRSYSGQIAFGVEASAGVGVGVSIGPASFEATLCKLSASGGISKGIALTETYEEDGTKTLELIIEDGVELGATVGSGVGMTVLGKDLDLVTASANAGMSAALDYGVKIHDFNYKNLNHLLSIGGVLLYAYCKSSNSLSISQIADWILKELAINQTSGSVSAYVGYGAEILGTDFAGTEFALLGWGGTLAITNAVSIDESDKKNVRRAVSYEMTCDEITGLLQDLAPEGGASTNAVNVTANVNLSQNTLESVSYSNYVGKKKELLWYTEQTDTLPTDTLRTITVEGENAQNAATANNDLYNLAYLNRTLFTLSEVNEMGQTIADFPAQVEYTTIHKRGLDVSFDIGATVFVGVNVNVSAMYEESVSYNNVSGVYVNGEQYLTAVSTLAYDDDIPKAGLFYLANLIENAMKEAWEAFKEEIASEFGELVDGIKNAYYSLKGTVIGWFADISCWSEISHGGGSRPFRSYAILALPMAAGSAEPTAPVVAVTLGEPYTIVVYTDETRQTQVSDEDLAAAPLELTLRYDQEMLTAAGVTADADINIYYFDMENNIYICLDSVQDKLTMSVTALVDRHGEYILATDNAAPLVSEFSVSNRTSDLTITANVNDLSGIKEFEFRLDDGAVLVDESNLYEYYDRYSGVFTYPCEDLSGGEHTAYFKVADTLGNTTNIPFSFTFTVDASAPVISQVTVPSETVSSAEDFVVAVVAEDNETVASVMAEVDIDGEKLSVPLTLVDNIWTATVTGIKGSYVANVKFVVMDAAGNLTESASYAVTVDLPVFAGYAVTVGELTDGSVTVTVRNYESTAMSGWLLCAVYDDNGMMLGLCSEYIGLRANETAEFAFKFEGNVTSVANVRAYLLDVSNGYRPMT